MNLDLLFLVKNNPFFKFLLKFKVILMCGYWGQQLPQNNIQTSLRSKRFRASSSRTPGRVSNRVIARKFEREQTFAR